MIDKNIVTTLVEEYISESDVFLVDVTISKENKILVEIDSDEGISIDYCVEMSRFLESKLDREVEDYELEVGSAGLSAPFKVCRQYQKYEGEEVEVLDGKGGKFKGILVNVGEESFGLQVTSKVKTEGSKKKVEVTEVLTFDYDKVKQTKYSIRFK